MKPLPPAMRKRLGCGELQGDEFVGVMAVNYSRSPLDIRWALAINLTV
jgi:hypothetical protein